MNKPQLQERARELGIPFEDSDTNKVLEAKIAEVEAAKKEDKEPLNDNAEEGRGADTVAVVEDSNGDEFEVYSDGSVQKAEFEGEVKVDENSDESEEVSVKDEEAPQPVASIITTSTIAAPERDKKVGRPDVQEAEPVEVEKTPSAAKEQTIYRYKGSANTYQTSKYRFSKAHPFVAVDNEFAEKNLKDHPKLEKSSESEARKFYGE